MRFIASFPPSNIPCKTASCWVLSDGRPGMQTQVLGLAHALQLTPITKRITARPPWCWLPAVAWGWPLLAPDTNSDPLLPPWPKLLISTGRTAAAPAAAIRRAAQGATFVIHIQDPGLSPSSFDAIILPEHDRRRAPEIILSQGSLNTLTPSNLQNQARILADDLTKLPRPLILVLLGGPNRAYHFTMSIIESLVTRLIRLAQDGAGLLISGSYRTPPEILSLLRTRLAGLPMRFWPDSSCDPSEKNKQNPYPGWLGVADQLIVTCDSTNMISEATFTGKPVHLVRLAGQSSKFSYFHASMIDRGFARWLDLTDIGPLASWSYPPLRETQRIAALLRSRFTDRLPPLETEIY